MTIPELPLPPLDEALRRPFRRLLSNHPDDRNEILRFLAARGRAAHPDDWMPKADDDTVPELYAPWCDWARRRAVPPGKSELSMAARWGTIPPARRRAILKDIRHHVPDVALAIIEAKIARESAAERLRLVELLEIGLSASDEPFLLTLAANEHAPKVAERARWLLCRLGNRAMIDAVAAELASFFRTAEGDLKRIHVDNRGLKPGDTERRARLFTAVGIDDFAAALGHTPEHVVHRWPWGECCDAAFVEMVARTGTDDLVEQLSDSLTYPDLANASILALIAPRLGFRHRDWLAEQVLVRGGRFSAVFEVAGGSGRMHFPMAAPAGVSLLDRLGNGSPGIIATEELFALGLIATQHGAAEALEQLAPRGLKIDVHRQLDMLWINAGLDDAA